MHGLYLVWLVHERGFPPALVATLMAAGDLCVFALEIPTGWIADRLGHRISLVIGSLLQVVAMLAFWRASTAPALLGAILLVALGDAFRSGAGEALLYQSCAALGCESEFRSIEGRTRSVSLVALVALLVAGGAIAQVAGYAAAWITEIALSTAGLVLAIFMIEPPAVGQWSRGSQDPGPRTRSWRTILTLMLPAACLDGLSATASFLAQTQVETGITGVTALVAAITLSEAAGSWVSARVWRNDGRLHLLLLACGTAGFAASRVIPAGAAAAAVALAFLPGLIYPLRAAALQQAAGDGVRARIASLASACDMACSTLGLLAAGAMSARRGRRCTRSTTV